MSAVVLVEADIAQMADALGWAAVCDAAPELVGRGDTEDEATADLVLKLNEQMNNRVLH